MTRILLADRHPVCREGVRQLIAEQSLASLVDETGTESALVELLGKHQYRLIILDFSMAETDARTLIGRIRALVPATPILVMSYDNERIYAAQLLYAGVHGYVEKSAANHEIITAISKTLEGKRYIGVKVSEELVLQRQRKNNDPFACLSPRELEVARHLISGYSMGDISGMLGIGYSSVYTLRNRMFEKLYIRNVQELARLQKTLGC